MGGSFEQVNMRQSVHKKDNEALQQIMQLDTDRSVSGVGPNMLYQLSPSRQNRNQAMDIRSNASINSKNMGQPLHQGGDVIYTT